MGSQLEAPAAVSSTAISVRLATSKCPMAAIAKITRPTSAIAVITNITLSASPTPARWIPMKIRYAARYTHQPSVMPNSPSDST